MELLDLIFYTIGFVFMVASIGNKKIPFLSFTGIYLRLLFLFLYLPAYYIYRGGINYDEQAQISNLVYSLLLFQLVISSILAIVVWNRSCSFKIKFDQRSRGRFGIYLVMLAAILYLLGYFALYFDKIPLFNILSGELLMSGMSRAELTHGDLNDSGIFAFYRPITKDLLFVLLGGLILSNKISSSLKLACFVLLSVSLLAHLEKYYIIMLIILVMTLRSRIAMENRFSDIKFAFVCFISLILVTYLFFAESFSDAVQYVPYRLMLQTGYVSEQLLISENYAPLFFDGINMGFVGRIFDVDYFNFQKLAWESVHHDQYAAGITGSSAGLAAVEGYILFSVFGSFLLLLIIYLHFVIDKLIKTSLIEDEIKPEKFPLDRSFYLYYISLYPICMVSSIFGVFSFPYLFQPGFILCALTVLLFFRIRIASKVR